MEIRSEFVNLSADDGTTMRAYAARPATPGAHPGLIVGQEAFGVNAHIRDITERFAREGYVAIAPELFHRTGPGFEGRYDDFPSAMPHTQALRHPQLEADLRASHGWLTANGVGKSPIAAVGFCMGGMVAFLAALTLPIACAVSFYGGGIAPSAQRPGLLDRASELRAPVMLIWGGRDKHLGPDVVRSVTDALRAAGKNFVNVEFSDADHGFFCDARPAYHAVSAAEAWPLTLAFLSVHSSAAQRE
ncbi:MAG: dienelactone hydrolase family protein [Candidatus Acidiferrales bacterium]|jgi:carboxymethylenebutenolidase